jgi:hypothetical protein
MRKPPHRRPSRRRAIEQALSRLGMQARPQQVVAHLAGYDIAVNEGLVQRVRIDLLRKLGDQQSGPVKPPGQRTRLRRPQKVPPRRG